MRDLVDAVDLRRLSRRADDGDGKRPAGWAVRHHGRATPEAERPAV